MGRFINAPTNILAASLGRVDVLTKMTSIQSFIIIIIIYPLSVVYGLKGIIIASFISIIFVTIF